ncbi:MAG TPA: hypothetical protein PK437_11520 [Thiobacillaceae bacterium]|nr:hypothetical protein [Thiobacillaceae bacterium]
MATDRSTCNTRPPHPGWLRILFFGLAALSLGEPMRQHADALASADSPLGILSLQLVWDADVAARMLAAWGPEGRSQALLSLAWDCPFALAYGLALASLGKRLAHASQGSWLAVFLSLAPLAAACLDLAENAFHGWLILDFPATGTASLAAPACLCALAKWGLLVAWLMASLGLAARRALLFLTRR